jgi:hypothetical protein
MSCFRKEMKSKISAEDTENALPGLDCTEGAMGRTAGQQHQLQRFHNAFPMLLYTVVESL